MNILKQWIDLFAQTHNPHSPKPTPETSVSSIQVETLSQLPNPEYINLIPEHIRSHELPKLKHFIRGTFQVQSKTIQQKRTVEVYISSTTPSVIKHNQTTPPLILQRIQMAVELLSNYAPEPCKTQPLHIYLYLTKSTKTIPQLSGEVLDEIHANTAFANICDMNTSKTPDANPRPKYIILYREEEVFKVLFHELFHSLGLDFSHDELATRKTAEHIRQHFSLSITDIRLFETYCETWATILNCLFIAYLQHIPPQPHLHPHLHPFTPTKSANTITPQTTKSIIRTFFQLFSEEQTYVLFQCAKILRHNRLSYQPLVSSCRSLSSQKIVNSKHRKTKKIKGGKHSIAPGEYKENTQVFCYYILKSAVFQNIQLFLQRFPPPFSVQESDAFSQFVQECFTHTKFETQLHLYTALFDNTVAPPSVKTLCVNPQPQDKTVCETMRQTVNEIEIV
jgi:hypothetical protein